MYKDGPQEKEKILRRLSEKEIQAQLYGYGTAGPVPAVDSVARPQNDQPPKFKQQQKQSKAKAQPKDPYLIWQVVLLAFFLILIWMSARQIINAVSHDEQNTQKIRILQHGIKNVPKKR
jgi:hypothetical protein